MRYNYSKLKGRIKEKYNTQAEFAKALGISATALSQKLNNSKKFTQTEITKAGQLLDVNDFNAYFFNIEVDIA